MTTPPAIPGSDQPDAPIADPGLLTALASVLGRASELLDLDVVVGTAVDGRPETLRRTGPATLTDDTDVVAPLADLPDGAVRTPGVAGTPGWCGARSAIGNGRYAFALVAASEVDDLTESRLTTFALEIARAALIEDERNRRGQIDQLLTTARNVAESLDPDTVLASIVEDATSLLGADSGDMLLWDRASQRLRVVAVSNFPPGMLGFEFPFGEGLSSQAILAQRPLEIEDYSSYDLRIRALDRYRFGSVLCAPLLFRGDAIGAINVHRRDRSVRFPNGSADLLAAFAGHAAIAIDHARRYENEVSLGRDLAETNQGLTRLLGMQQRLAEHVLLDGDADGIATLLATELGRSVVIQDHLHRTVAGAAPDGGDAWRPLVDDGARSGRATRWREPFTVAVRVGRDVAGHLVLSSDEDLGPVDRGLVDAATTGVALAFAKVRAALEVEERLRGEA
ncbi:MAG TPA: GAF domain-containing protein, partial [Candidatus Limnocylindrales bacterium]